MRTFQFFDEPLLSGLTATAGETFSSTSRFHHGDTENTEICRGEEGLLEWLYAFSAFGNSASVRGSCLRMDLFANAKSLATPEPASDGALRYPRGNLRALRASVVKFPPDRPWRPCQFRCSSSMCARMIASKFVSASKPNERARDASRLRGHPSTIRMMTGSGWRRMSFTRSAPAHRPRLSIISLTVAERPGIERFLRGPTSAPSISAARKKNPTAEPGDAN